MIIRLLLFGFFFLVGFQISQAQSKVTDVEELIEKKDFKRADNIIHERINNLLQTGSPDSLSDYIIYLGNTATQLRGFEKAKQEIYTVIKKAKEKFLYNPDLPYVFLIAADFFSKEGENAISYDLLKQLQKYFKGKEHLIAEQLSKIESNMGTYAMRMGNYTLASSHFRESIRLFHSSSDLTGLFITNNSMGIIMWYASKLDSSLFYFKKTIEVLQKADTTPLNRYQRMAMVQGNISNVYWELGNVEESIRNAEQSAAGYKLYSVYADNQAEKEKGLRGHCLSVYNLGITYQNLGNFSKALELLNYTYNERLKQYGPQSPEVYKSLLTIGSIYYEQKNYTKAVDYLSRSLVFWKNQGANIWYAQACTFLAYTYAEMDNAPEAAMYYEEAARLYNDLQEQEYSLEYLDFMTNAASFYASHRQAEKAETIGEKGIQYVIKNQGEQSLLAAQQLTNMANVYFESGQYSQTINYCNRALSIMDQLVKKSDRLLDSIRIEMNKPSAVLLKIKAEYEQEPQTKQVLLSYLEQLKPAVALLERRKNIFTDEKDVNILLANNRDLHDFINRLQLQLYQLTGDQSYIDKVIDMHESVIYSRIRSGIDRQKAVHFLGVPSSVLQKETLLKQNIAASLVSNRAAYNERQKYVDGVNNWNTFLNNLKKDYPQYYQLRYASLSNFNVEDLKKGIPSGVTIIRYFFVGDSLYALVADNANKNWVSLSVDSLQKKVERLMDMGSDDTTALPAAFELYTQIWQPLEKFITHGRIVIIPDGILYYLSFDLLPVKPVRRFKELSSSCLLLRYAISYHYSLLAFPANKTSSVSLKGIAAFVPGFMDDVKGKYKALAGGDTLTMDQGYLSLLPLPFSMELAKKVEKKYGGEIFIGENSTQEIFRTKAGQHAIIHLGTHAEANNQYPEFSRLIFARNPLNVHADNSLYLYDIYNCDLTSELSVLTACETGRPGFYPGEGMISMAHAFNYAGSNSILTGLWRIDEQVSAVITGYFYENLQKGMTKDKALQQAKLLYLQQAEGRLLAPQYWAGLVIMGDTSPITLNERGDINIYWLAGIGLLLMGLLLTYQFIKKKRLHTQDNF